MCWWVTTISSMSSIEWPCSASWCCELVERLARVRAGVHERQRLVLDQVGVHPADGEGRRDPQRWMPASAARASACSALGSAECVMSG